MGNVSNGKTAAANKEIIHVFCIAGAIRYLEYAVENIMPVLNIVGINTLKGMEVDGPAAVSHGIVEFLLVYYLGLG